MVCTSWDTQQDTVRQRMDRGLWKIIYRSHRRILRRGVIWWRLHLYKILCLLSRECKKILVVQAKLMTSRTTGLTVEMERSNRISGIIQKHNGQDLVIIKQETESGWYWEWHLNFSNKQGWYWTTSGSYATRTVGGGTKAIFLELETWFLQKSFNKSNLKLRGPI